MYKIGKNVIKRRKLSNCFMYAFHVPRSNSFYECFICILEYTLLACAYNTHINITKKGGKWYQVTEKVPLICSDNAFLKL